MVEALCFRDACVAAFRAENTPFTSPNNPPANSRSLRFRFQHRRDQILYGPAAGSLGFYHPFIRLSAARAGLGQVQELRRKRQVGVFGKAVGRPRNPLP